MKRGGGRRSCHRPCKPPPRQLTDHACLSLCSNLAVGFVIGAGIGAGGCYVYLQAQPRGQAAADTSELVEKSTFLIHPVHAATRPCIHWACRAQLKLTTRLSLFSLSPLQYGLFQTRPSSKQRQSSVRKSRNTHTQTNTHAHTHTHTMLRAQASRNRMRSASLMASWRPMTSEQRTQSGSSNTSRQITSTEMRPGEGSTREQRVELRAQKWQEGRRAGENSG
jgi:hypothetical protein